MGGKKGGGGHTPYEAPDSLKSAQKLRAIGLISLGPIRGAVTADEYQSAFFDYTPLKNAQGEWNYQNTEIRYALGTQDQTPLTGFEMSEREVSVGAEVKVEHPLSRTIIDPDITRLRVSVGVNALFQQQDNGDTVGTSVQLQFLINGEHKQTITIDGKSSSRFHRSYILDNLPPVPFTLTVKRLTADSKSQRLQNATFWSSYTEIIDTQLSYPNMAIVGIKTDSRYNPNFPNMNFLLYGRLVKVPSNYDPDTRTYAAGIWRGDFKLAWTNNPAWVFYDLVTNKLAGLGQRLGDYGVDKFQLYQIAQYCDQLVPDGYGGFEPRMVANLWITEQRDAYSVISDMASVFRAIAVWNGTQLTAIQDRSTDPVCSYSQANVIGGKFNRQYVPLKSIYTAVEVEYADEKNFYQKAIEYVADDDLIRRYGYNVKKIVAFACTSRGQARRYGKWVLETSRLEQCTLTFSVGREGLQTLPGDIIEIADKSYANFNLGGRVLAVNGRFVTLDAPIELAENSHLGYVSASGETRRTIYQRILAVNAENKAIVELDRESADLAEMATWSLHTPLVHTQRYRVLSIGENEDGSYTITALQHSPQKERIVDEGAVFEPTTDSLHQVQAQLTYLSVDGTFSGGTKIQWETSSSNGVLTFDIRILRNGILYLFKKGQTDSQLDLDDLPDGDYTVTVIARNEKGQIVSEQSQSFTINRPPVPKNVRIVGGLSDISLSWDYVDDFTQTEIWASETNDIATAKRVAKVLASFYSHNVGARQTRYYWLRHTRGQNLGEFYQQQGIQGQSGADIDEELRLLNEKLSQPIIDQVFDVAAPARQLEMIKVVPTIANYSQFLGHTLIKNQADGRLYKWNGRSYTFNTPSSEIDGQILPAQLADIPSSKLSGQLSDAQIREIRAAKISGQLGDHQIQAISVRKLQGEILPAQLAKIPTTKLSGRLSAEQIEANAIGANHIAAGVLTADKFTVGLGGNLLTNPIFANGANGWFHYINQEQMHSPAQGLHINQATGTYQGNEYLPTENQWRWQTNRKNTNGGNLRLGGLYQDLNVVAGQWYCFSAYVAGHRSFTSLNVEGLDGTIKMLSWSGVGVDAGYQNGLQNARRIWMVFKTNSTKKVRFIINFWANGSENNPFVVVRRPMLEECTEHTREPSPWQNAGVTAIHGGSIITDTIDADKIQANAVTAVKIASNAITTEKLSASAVLARHIATGAIVSEKIAANAITTEKIAANAVNAGKIAANSIATNHLQANVITAGKIATNAVQAGNIQTGAINAHHIQAGQISADKLAIGLGGNLLTNPIFANDGYEWSVYSYPNVRLAEQRFTQNHSWLDKQIYLPTENLAYISIDDTNNSIADGARVLFLGKQSFPIIAGKSYIFSGFASAHRMKVRLMAELRSSTGAYLGTYYSSFATASFRHSIENASRLHVKFSVPTGRDINKVDLYFMCEKSGSHSNAMLFAMRPMLEECTEHATQPSPWQNAGVTAIHGGVLLPTVLPPNKSLPIRLRVMS